MRYDPRSRLTPARRPRSPRLYVEYLEGRESPSDLGFTAALGLPGLDLNSNPFDNEAQLTSRPADSSLDVSNLSLLSESFGTAIADTPVGLRESASTTSQQPPVAAPARTEAEDLGLTLDSVAAQGSGTLPAAQPVQHSTYTGQAADLLAAVGSISGYAASVTAPVPGNVYEMTDMREHGARLAQTVGSGFGGIMGGGGSTGPIGSLGTIKASGPNCTNPPGRGRIQSETTVAWGYGEDTFALVAGYNDFRGFYCANEGPGYQVTGISYSLDYGATWEDQGRLPGGTSLRGDPWLATGPDGSVYLASLWNGLQGIGVLKGTVSNAGISWSNPTVIQRPGNSYDKEAMAVDWTTGNIYVTFTQFGTGGRGIEVLRSTDGGLSFEPNRRINSGAVQGSFPMTGPKGEVYVAYNIGYPSNTGTGFAYSTDFGVTWTDVGRIGTIQNFTIPGFNRGTHPNFPSMAVDPASGIIYVTYSTAHLRGNGDVVLQRSLDGGQTWSAPVRVNDDNTTGIQFYPTVSLDYDGNVNVFFYDRRHAPGSASTHVYFAQSTDSGETFGENLQITEVPTVWGPSSDGTPNFGDYIGSMSIGNYGIVAYADGRDGTPSNADPDAYLGAVGPA